MALGAVEVSPVEMAQAYDAFANGGKRITAYGISRIRTREGRVIYQRSARESRPIQAIANPPLLYMNDMLRGVITSGTARSVAISGRDLAGKTGTTSDYKDAWFVGYTGGFVTAVWVGKDDNTAMRGVTGGQAPAAIWRAFMTAALPRLDAPRRCSPPPSIASGSNKGPEKASETDTINSGLPTQTAATVPRQPARSPEAVIASAAPGVVSL